MRETVKRSSFPFESQQTPTNTLSSTVSSALSLVGPFQLNVVHENEDSTIALNLNLPPMDRGKSAWTFCVASFILEMNIYGFCFSYGILQDYYMSHPPFDKGSHVALASVGPIAIALQYLPALIISYFFTRYPDYIRLSVWIGLALSFFSLFFSSWATQVWHLILLQGVMYGGSGGLLYVPVVMLLSDWFQKKRGLATGIIFAGAGVGGFVFPFIMTSLINKIGLPWMIRTWAMATTVLNGVAILGIRPRTSFQKYKSSHERPKWFQPPLLWVKKPLYWSVSFTIFLQGVSFFPVSLYIVNFARELINPLTATIVLSIFNSSAVGGQILLGHVSDRVSYTKIMIASSLGSAISVFLLWGLANSAVQLYFFVIIFGVLSGGFSSTWPSAAYDMVGCKAEFIGLGLTSSTPFKGISAVIGPVISGLLLEVSKGTSMGGVFGREGYGAVEIFVGTCSLATVVGSLLVSHYSKKDRDKDKEDWTDPMRLDSEAEVTVIGIPHDKDKDNNTETAYVQVEIPDSKIDMTALGVDFGLKPPLRPGMRTIPEGRRYV